MTRQALAILPADIRWLYWAAGFMEGEGSFLWNGTTAIAEARQVDPTPVVILHEMFGGVLKPMATLGNRQEIFYWKVYGMRARGVMMTLYPLLSLRRQDQIKRALR